MTVELIRLRERILNSLSENDNDSYVNVINFNLNVCNFLLKWTVNLIWLQPKKIYQLNESSKRQEVI